MDSQNQVMGDSMGIDLPQKPVDETAINELKHKAKYSRSTEFKELRAKAQAKIEFYQRYLPSGQPIGMATPEEMKGKWELANLIIAELQQLFDEHDNAEAILKELYGE